MTTGKTIVLTRRTFVGEVTSLPFNMLSSLVTVSEPQFVSQYFEYSFLCCAVGPCVPILHIIVCTRGQFCAARGYFSFLKQGLPAPVPGWDEEEKEPGCGQMTGSERALPPDLFSVDDHAGGFWANVHLGAAGFTGCAARAPSINSVKSVFPFRGKWALDLLPWFLPVTSMAALRAGCVSVVPSTSQLCKSASDPLFLPPWSVSSGMYRWPGRVIPRHPL